MGHGLLRLMRIMRQDERGSYLPPRQEHSIDKVSLWHHSGVELPETRYTRLGQDRIAYQVVGEGPPDILYTAGSATHVDVSLEYPRFQYVVRRLASFGRLTRFDRRGSGASDPVSGERLPSWEIWIDDIKAVLDTIDSERATILAVSDAGPVALLFAATYPERTSGLILVNTYARFLADTDYPAGLPNQVGETILDRFTREWGTESLASSLFPSLANDRASTRWLAKIMRASLSPRAAAANMRQIMDLDARPVIATIQAPALVMHSRNLVPIPIAQGRYLAEKLPNATFVELPGGDGPIYGEAMEPAIEHIERFLTGATQAPERDRVLATIVFTDIVGSTARLSELGDKRWLHTLEAHDEVIHRSVDSFHGRVVRTTGDGVLALFDGPGRALHCSFELRDQISTMGIDIRTGVHTGEVELSADGQVGGIAVHIAARVIDQANPGEILVSRTVRDLVTGGAFSFESRGRHSLKGISEQWELFAAKS